MGLHCLTIPKSWELISWQFLLAVVLSLRLLMRTVIITIKRNGYIYFKFLFSTKQMVWVIKSTVAMRRFLSTRNIKPWLQIKLTSLQNFVKVYTNSKNRNDSVYTPTQHFYTSNHGFVVTTMQQQTSFFIKK